MCRKASSGMMLILLLIGMLTLAFNIQPVKSMDGTIYIRADGSVDPPDAPISSMDNVTYTFTGNINDSIVVERDNIVVDGAGYTAQGTGSGTGIDLSYRKNVTIKNMEIKLFYYGIKLAYSLNNTISGNNLTTNYISGIELCESSHSNIHGNNIAERHSLGITLDQSSNYNTISENNITENGWGIKLSSSNNNTVFRNNMAANEQNGIKVFYSSNNSIYENSIANNQQLGIMLSGSSNYNNIYGNKIINNGFGGIRFHSSLKNSVSGNNITSHLNGYGIKLEYSSNYTLSGNSIANNQWGIEFEYSSNYNSVYANNITNNEYGIWFWNSSSNSIYHNNFVNNAVHKVTSIPYLVNVWDDGYPSGGNYWSGYSGGDFYTGPGQNLTEGIGSDGIGDTPYVIDTNNNDHYPLMIPWTSNPLIHPQEGQYANYTLRAIDLQTGTIQNEEEFTLTYHKYVSPFLMYVTSPKGYGDICWTALNITNRYAYNCIWPITGIIKDMWFPWLIETTINIGSTIRVLNGTGTVIGDKTINVNSRPIDCWELTCIEEITPETSWEHTFWCHKYTGLLIGQEAIYGSIKVNTTLTDTNIISLLQMPKTWTVDDDGPADFHTIQEAINASSDGDTVFVYNGTYLENVIVNRSISLVGENKHITIIDSEKSWAPVVEVTSNNVKITRFTVQHGHNGFLLDSNSTIINDNILFENDFHGIQLTGCSYSIIISNNNVTSNGLAYSGYCGILVDGTNHTIYSNTISNNAGHGLALGSSSSIVRANDIADNGYGHLPYYEHAGLVIGPDASDNTIIENSISENLQGILLVSSNNTIYHNNLINNKEQVHNYDSANTWDNGYPSGGNYWSDYSGADADGNGIGDTPYVIDANNTDRYPLMHPWSSLPVHNINTGSGYETIQEAINAKETLDGHTIFVEAGIYYELVFVNKTIHLLGEGRVVTVIDGEVDVTANGVVISGFSIGGFTAFISGMRMWFGIRLSGANCTVSNNTVFNTGTGVWLLNSTNNVISNNALLYNIPDNVRLSDSSNNKISQNYIGPIEWKGLILPLDYGIDLYRSSDNTIIQNNVTQCRRAIRMEGVMPQGGIQSDSSNNTVIGNNIEHWEWGISLDESTNNTVVGNNITCLSDSVLLGESSGISLYRSHFNSIAQNSVESNYEGLKLADSHLNNISQNNIVNSFYGLKISSSTLNLMSQNNIKNNYYGILVGSGYSGYINTLRYNNMTENRYNFGVGYWHFQDVDETNTVDGKPVYYWVNRRDGQIPSDAGYVAIVNSTNIKVEGLDLKNNYQGILIAYSNNVTICQNNITDNYNGIWLVASSDNTIYHNNFINNTNQADSYESMSVWDDGYPSGGNYWSDYAGVDAYSGPCQNETGSDGIGDTPYIINADNVDRYPLVNPWTPIETNVKVNDKDYPVTIVSNTTIDQIIATKNTLCFKSSGPTGQKGYINVIFPVVNTTEIKVFIDDVKLTPPPFPIINTNGTHYFIYFEFTLSTHNIAIQFAPIEYTLTIDSSPTGITFTINGISKTTPYTECLPEGSYTLEMPETHDGYVWSHWLEDGDTNRIRTITLSGTTWTGVYVPAPHPPPECVGGEIVLIDHTEFIPSPLTSHLTILAFAVILATAIPIIYIRHRKKRQT